MRSRCGPRAGRRSWRWGCEGRVPGAGGSSQRAGRPAGLVGGAPGGPLGRPGREGVAGARRDLLVGALAEGGEGTGLPSRGYGRQRTQRAWGGEGSEGRWGGGELGSPGGEESGAGQVGSGPGLGSHAGPSGGCGLARLSASSPLVVDKADPTFFFFFLTSLLEYNCFTMVC